MRSGLAILMACEVLLAGAARAGESFNARYNHANSLLRAGDTDAALSILKDLQVEQPESDALYYGVGSAQYEAGVKALENKQAAGGEDADKALQAAAEAFKQASLSPNPVIRERAGYNLANAMASRAMLAERMQNAEEAVNQYKAAIEQYMGFLDRYPEHQGARHNLDSVRYRLKKLLQNPPEQKQDQQQQQQQKQDQQKQGDQQQQNAQSGQDQQQDQQQQQAQQDQQQAQQQQGDQGQPDKQKDQQDQQKEQQAAPESSGQQDPVDLREQKDDGKQAQEPRDRNTIEAILQSLEDQDKQVQRDLRNPPPNQGVNREWW